MGLFNCKQTSKAEPEQGNSRQTDADPLALAKGNQNQRNEKQNMKTRASNVHIHDKREFLMIGKSSKPREIMM